MTAEQTAILDRLSPRGPLHLFEQSGYTSLCCAKSGDGVHPCVREREDECHERSFSLYRISATWVQNGVRGESESADSWRVRDLPEGRIRNRTGFDTMRRERDDLAEPNTTASWFAGYRAKKEGDGAWSGFELSAKFIGEETWCSGWFSHWRFDLGENDAEVLDSFRRYVRRRERQNDEARRKWNANGFGDGVGSYFTEPWCLMGAEDEYRWCARAEGTGIIGGGPTTGSAPCRCDGCRKNGVVRIDH